MCLIQRPTEGIIEALEKIIGPGFIVQNPGMHSWQQSYKCLYLCWFDLVALGIHYNFNEDQQIFLDLLTKASL